MSEYTPVVGDRVRVIKSSVPYDVPNGTEGTVKTVVFDGTSGGPFWLETESLDRPLGLFGHGWAMLGSEVEKV